jgi:hypothetical protein
MKRNTVAKSRRPIAKLMWADFDPDDGQTPLSVYPTKSEQRGCRPDLKPIPVAVIELDRPLPEIVNALCDLLERRWEANRNEPL